MYRNILMGIIAALTLLLLILIFLLGNQWYYEGLGDEKFNTGKYTEAADIYLKALEQAEFTGQPRLLYKVGLAYQNSKDGDRAKDYYFRLVQLYPDSQLTKLVGPQLEKMFRDENLTESFPAELGGGASLQTSKSRYVRAYQNLTKLLKLSRAGVPADLEAAYHTYKSFHEEYKRQVVLALDQYRVEHPDFKWPPEGATQSPNPVPLDSIRPSPSHLAPKGESPDKLNIPVKGRAETRPDVERELSGAKAPQPAGP